MNRIITALIFSLIVAGCSSQTKNGNVTMQTVKNVDLERYMGTWYEIGRFPHSFEKDLVGVTATYKLKKNGKVEVLNQGYKNSLDGKLKRAKGFAKVPNPNEPGRLKVYFFWPFGGDYLILDLDEEYRWALIGSYSLNYLWILSRTPQMPEEEYNRLVEKARSLGYNVSRIERVEQRVEP
ncbi:MAG TPA: lipocalin family protein [Tenuifilaceae bacterium]|nr:lipocalin family protein [Tenuifilaceae bacterium]HPE17484.1 lipocalin family protein [Tenuifilaceae bacterium]HPJ45146.1 lipocalin family protein [Tenuifilaceae bacterium]HPQ33745.1 lipocalin family protein [Tenuifilaceae bacterium]HRX67030.1 lipocalin family protein [Tenuifilaceae bacterium]